MLKTQTVGKIEKSTLMKRTLKSSRAPKSVKPLATKSILHGTRLDTMMVEATIKKHSGEFKKKALWEHLPKKMMYQTYCVVIDYLVETRRIGIDRNGVIGWTYDPEGARYYLSRTDLAWKKDA